jgi:hypothetical protein
VAGRGRIEGLATQGRGDRRGRRRPDGIFAPRSATTACSDRKRRSRPREHRGKPTAFPETAGNRIYVGLRGGRTRTRTLDPLIKSSSPSPFPIFLNSLDNPKNIGR